MLQKPLTGLPRHELLRPITMNPSNRQIVQPQPQHKLLDCTADFSGLVRKHRRTEKEHLGVNTTLELIDYAIDHCSFLSFRTTRLMITISVIFLNFYFLLLLLLFLLLLFLLLLFSENCPNSRTIIILAFPQDWTVGFIKRCSELLLRS